jgi:hypothetical protein
MTDGMMEKFVRQVKRSLSYRGVWGTLALVLSQPYRTLVMHTRLQHWVKARRDRQFDRAHGVDTDGLIRLRELSVDYPTWQDGNRYEAIDADVCRRLLALLPIRHEEFTFIDFGSGKGRALLLAAEYPYREIIGVEFAPALHDVAERNLRTYRNPRQRAHVLRAICTDATLFDLPPDPLVLFFANPFNEPVMEKVLDNIRRSFEARPRPMYVVYFNATCAHLFTRLSFLTEMPSPPWYRMYVTATHARPARAAEAGRGRSEPVHGS